MLSTTSVRIDLGAPLGMGVAGEETIVSWGEGLVVQERAGTRSDLVGLGRTKRTR